MKPITDNENILLIMKIRIYIFGQFPTYTNHLGYFRFTSLFDFLLPAEMLNEFPPALWAKPWYLFQY